MKLLICASLITFFSFSMAKGQIKDPYAVQITGLNQEVISVADYKTKKIVVVEFDASAPDRTQLLLLDKLYKKFTGQWMVIGVPVKDFGIPMSALALKKLVRDTLKITFPVAEISTGKKGTGQNLLLKWLTSKSLNGHFDRDLEIAGEIFFITEKGILYATLIRNKYQKEDALNQVSGLQVNE